MRQTFIPILLISVFFSCKKSNDSMSMPLQLTSDTYQVLTYPKMYVRSGEITDKTAIERYLNNLSLIRVSFFYLNSDTVIRTNPDTIHFVSRDTAIFSQPGPFGRRIIKQMSPYTFFYMTDTLIGDSRYPDNLDSIYDNIGLIKPYHKNFCNSPSCYSPFGYVYDAFIATGNLDKFEFPLLTFYITRNSFYNTPIDLASKKNYNNVFDNSVLNKLIDGDTLVIQTLKRSYTK